MNGECGTLIKPCAVGRDCPSMHFRQLTRHGEPDAEAAFRAIERPIRLSKQIEHSGDHFGSQTNPSVTNSNHSLVIFAAGTHRNASTVGCVFGGVGEKV